MAAGIKILNLSEVTTPVAGYAIGIADSATTNVYITIANLQKLWVTDVDANGQNLDNIQNLIHDLSTSGTDVDFDEDELQEISISANTTFTGTNYATGRTKVVKITTDGTLRTLDFPGGWIFIGGSGKPADQAASKQAILSLTCFTGAEAGVIASYAVEP